MYTTFPKRTRHSRLANYQKATILYCELDRLKKIAVMITKAEKRIEQHRRDVFEIPLMREHYEERIRINIAISERLAKYLNTALNELSI